MKLITSLLFYCLPFLSAAQLSDSLLYSSPFEKEAIQDFVNGKRDTIQMFISPYENADQTVYNSTKNSLQQLYKELDIKKIHSLDPKKKIKLIFNTVHTNYFRQYEISKPFAEIFKSGVYNCVSGTALYAIVLHHYKIPFQIKEQLTHVYLIAYPETLNIVVESTLPGTGYISLTEQEKKQALDNVIALKYLTQEYVNKIGVEKAYHDFFFKDDGTITLENLAGIQYHNLATIALDEKRYEESLDQYEKCDIFYPSEKNKYLKTHVLGAILDNSDRKNLKFSYYLATYANLSKNEITIRYIKEAFKSIIYNFLIDKQDTLFLQKSFTILQAKLSNENLKKDIEQIYFTEFSKYYYNKGEYNHALHHAAKGFRVNPNNSEIQSLIAWCVLKGFAIGSSEKEIEQLDQSVVSFPFLKDNSIIQSAYIYNYNSMSINHFLRNQGTLGQKYLTLSESLMDKNTNLKIDYNQVGEVYLIASQYYYELGNKSKASALTNKGLQLSPNHARLIKWKNSK